MNYPRYIYKITNTANGRAYIGIADDPLTRFEAHFSALRHGKHEVEDFNEDYAKYPLDVWEFEVLEKVENQYQASREKWNQYFHKTVDRRYGYNYKEFLRVGQPRKTPYFPEAWKYIDALTAAFLFEERDAEWSKKIYATDSKWEKREIRKLRTIEYNACLDSIKHKWDYRDIYENLYRNLAQEE